MEDFRVINFENAHALVENAVNTGNGLLYSYTVHLNSLTATTLDEGLWIVVFMLAGKMEISMNAENRTVNAGEMFIFQPGDCISGISYDMDCAGRLLVIAKDRMLELVSEVEYYRYLLFLKDNPAIFLPASNREIITDCFRIIDRKLNNRKAGWQLAETSVSYLLHTLAVEVFEVLACTDIKNSMTYHNVFRRFMEMLGTMKIHRRRVDWYACHLNVSPKYLSEVCRKCSGRSASAWVKDYAILDVKRYLSDVRLSVKEVAYMLDYPNLSFFGKCVRRWFGMSPTALRNKLCKL